MTELQKATKAQLKRIERIITRAKQRGFSINYDTTYTPRKARSANLERLRTIKLGDLLKKPGSTYTGEATQGRTVTAIEGEHARRSAAALKREANKREARERKEIFSIFERVRDIINSIADERGIRYRGKWRTISLVTHKNRLRTALAKINETRQNADFLAANYARIQSCVEMINLDSDDRQLDAAYGTILSILQAAE